MIKEIEIVCPPGQQDDDAALKKLAANTLNIFPQKIVHSLFNRDKNIKTGVGDCV